MKRKYVWHYRVRWECAQADLYHQSRGCASRQGGRRAVPFFIWSPCLQKGMNSVPFCRCKLTAFFKLQAITLDFAAPILPLDRQWQLPRWYFSLRTGGGYTSYVTLNSFQGLCVSAPACLKAVCASYQRIPKHVPAIRQEFGMTARQCSMDGISAQRM